MRTYLFRSIVYLWALLFSACSWNSEKSAIHALEQVRTYMDQGQWSEAIYCLNILRNSSENPQILELLAFAYADNQQPYLAAQTFEQVVYADPNDEFQEDAWQAAQTYEQISNFRAAARCYRYYLKHFPKDCDAWFSLSKCEEFLGNDARALSAFLRAIHLIDSDLEVDTLVKLSELCLQNQLTKEALYWQLEVIKKYPQNISLYLKAVKIAHLLHDSKKLYQLILKLKDLDPTILKSNDLIFIQNEYASDFEHLKQKESDQDDLGEETKLENTFGEEFSNLNLKELRPLEIEASSSLVEETQTDEAVIHNVLEENFPTSKNTPVSNPDKFNLKGGTALSKEEFSPRQTWKLLKKVYGKKWVAWPSPYIVSGVGVDEQIYVQWPENQD